MIGFLFGALIGFIGFIIALPLDALAIKIRQKLDGGKPSLKTRLAGFSKLGKSRSQIGKQNVSGRLPKKADKSKKEKKKDNKDTTKENKDKKKDDKSKDNGSDVLEVLGDTSKNKDIKLQLKELALRASAALIRFSFKALGALVQFIITTFGIYLVIVLIVCCIMGYVIGYTNMYAEMVKQQEETNADGTRRRVRQESDENLTNVNKKSTASIWGAFNSKLDEGDSEEGKDEKSNEDVERTGDSGVVKNPDTPSKPSPSNPTDPTKPTDPTEPVDVGHLTGEIYQTPYAVKSGSPSQGANWTSVRLNGRTFWYQTQSNGSQTVSSGWNAQLSASCMLFATCAAINLKTSEFLTCDTIATNYMNLTGDNFQFVGNGGGTGGTIISNMIKANLNVSDVKFTAAIGGAGGYPTGVAVDSFQTKLDNALARGSTVIYHSKGAKSLGLSAGSQHWITIVGKTADGYYEVLTNGANSTADTALNGRGGARSAYYTAATLAQCCNNLWLFDF